MSGNISQLWGAAPGVQLIETRNAAEYLTMHGQPHHKGLLGPK